MDRYTLHIELAARRNSNVVFCNYTAIENTGLDPWTPSSPSAGRVPAKNLLGAVRVAKVRWVAERRTDGTMTDSGRLRIGIGIGNGNGITDY